MARYLYDRRHFSALNKQRDLPLNLNWPLNPKSLGHSGSVTLTEYHTITLDRPKALNSYGNLFLNKEIVHLPGGGGRAKCLASTPTKGTAKRPLILNGLRVTRGDGLSRWPGLWEFS